MGAFENSVAPNDTEIMGKVTLNHEFWQPMFSQMRPVLS
jgi:hypothetical protein